MAVGSPWKCRHCGYENSGFDVECFSCKKPISSGSSGGGSFVGGGRRRGVVQHLSTAHYVTMILLFAVTLFFLFMTAPGRELVNSVQIDLVMDFETTSFDDLMEDWSTFGAIVMLICGAVCLGGGIGGAIGGLIGGAILFCLICWICSLMWNYVFPFIVNAGAFGMLVALCIAFVLGTAVAAVNYIKSFFLYLNPYPVTPGVYDDGDRRYYQDKHKKREEFGRRSYFFGPGMFSIRQTIKTSWLSNFRLIGNVASWLGDCMDGWAWLMWIPGVPYFLFYAASILLVGSVVTIVCSLLHAIPMILIMIIIYILFSITWLIDRIYLQINSIKTSCPRDQTRAVIPAFQCSSCGNMHSHLVPGPYGIWHRRCTCGEVLPTTFLLGRSALKAFCPVCGYELAASDVQQFALTIVGGTSSGKTVLLSAFYHEFLKQVDGLDDVSYTIPDMHADMFQNLSDWFGGAECGATSRNETSDMYSILLHEHGNEVGRQFSLYDIAGEAFQDAAMMSMLPQKQMRDSDGIVIVIDPLSAQLMRREAKSEGDDTSNFSEDEASTVISNFVTYLKTVLTNTKLKVKSEKPVAVVITKSDLSSISRRISYHRIKMIMQQQPGTFRSFEEARDAISRDFLIDIGLLEAVQAIEAGFTNVHYFPVSAIGHNANGEEYEPEHVVEPFYWLIGHTQPDLARMLELEGE